MDPQKKLEWLHKIAKLGLEHVSQPQHFDAGGTVLQDPASNVPIQNAIDPSKGFIGGLNGFLGLNNNFQANASPVSQGTNTSQLNDAYTAAQNGISQQQGLTNQFQPGVAQGIGTQNALTGQLQNQAAGIGPNPAQAALNQATGQNIEQQAALMAGQRGAGANAGLLATQAARQGAGTQQQAVGQAATLQAQQQLGAQAELGNLAGQQIGQGVGAVQGLGQQSQNEQNILQGANSAYNNANVAQQGNINNVNAQVANANQNAATNTTGGILSGLSSIGHLIGLAHGGMVRMDQGGNVLDAHARGQIPQHDFALPGRRYPIHDENHARNALARVSQNGTSAEKKRVREAVQKKYPQMGAKKMACGGEAKMADGGFIPPANIAPQGSRMAPQSMAGQWVNSTPVSANVQPIDQGIQLSGNTEDFGKDLKGDGTKASKPSLPSFTGDNTILAGGPMDTAGMPGLAAVGMLAADGGKVKANSSNEKAVAKGDSLKNDKVPAMLSEGEIVIPRHITMSERAPEKAAAFVAATLAKRKGAAA